MKILVAGVGNIFLGDDAFGVEVVQRLLRQEIPEQVRLLDAGIRGVHLAYELLDGYDALILVDAVTHGEAPGTVSIFERLWEGGDVDRNAGSVADAHDLDPESVSHCSRVSGGASNGSSPSGASRHSSASRWASRRPWRQRWSPTSR